MPPGRVIVMLPCHTLDDFPTWLEEAEAGELLDAWTAAWHPALIAAAGRPPGHASVDLPAPADAVAGIVPAFCDPRFAAQADPDDPRGWVRGLADCDAITLAVADRLGVARGEGRSLPGDAWAEEMRALGLATLVTLLLARRMRSEAELATTGFDAAVGAAARAAVDGDEDAVRAGLAEAFGCLEAIRARFYAVDSWTVDVVLLAASTLGKPLLAELCSPVPLAVVATGATIRRLAERHPESLAALRAAVAEGRVEPCGGPDDERPLDGCSPEAIRESLVRGREAWQRHVGLPPQCHAAMGGGSSAILPQLLQGFGCRVALWGQFDGSPLPDPGCGWIRWEGTGGAAVEAAARPPLDAGRATSILALPERIGDALDHDHVAVIMFAHYAGRASRWHDLLRRIGARSGLVGTFVTPERLRARVGSGTPASFSPDAYAPLPPTVGEELADAAARATADAAAIAADRAGWRSAIAAPADPAPAPFRPAAAPRQGGRRLATRLFGPRRNGDDPLVLDNGLVELRPHPRTGGMLSLRRPADRANRISQQLAVRSTPADDHAPSGRMEAESIVRHDGAGAGRIESRGRLLSAAGLPLGRFVQRMALAQDAPLAVIDLEVELERPLAGPPLEAHVACRFAWHENHDVELRRSLHLQSVATRRRRFTAPHFVEIVPAGPRQSAADAVVVLTGGLPWHLLSSPHVLDSVVLAGGRSACRRMAVGIGLERPWDAAISLAGGERARLGTAVPANVRLTAAAPAAADASGALRVGLVESAGRAGEVRIQWARPVIRATAVDLAGRPRADVEVAVADRSTSVFLDRYQWLHLAVDLADPASPGAAP